MTKLKEAAEGQIKLVNEQLLVVENQQKKDNLELEAVKKDNSVKEESIGNLRKEIQAYNRSDKDQEII